MGVVAHQSFSFWTGCNGLLRFPRRLVSNPCRASSGDPRARHQIGVLQRSVKRPKLTSADRCLWAWLSSLWDGWQSRLAIFQAATVIGWHRKGFGLFWRWKTISERTVSRLLRGLPRPPSQTWKTFLHNHIGQMVSIDFFRVSTISMKVLFVFFVLEHRRREVLHFA